MGSQENSLVQLVATVLTLCGLLSIDRVCRSLAEASLYSHIRRLNYSRTDEAHSPLSDIVLRGTKKKHMPDAIMKKNGWLHTNIR